MSLSKVPIPIPTQKATPYFFSHFLLAFQTETEWGRWTGEMRNWIFRNRAKTRIHFARRKNGPSAQEGPSHSLSFESHDHQEPWSLGGAFD